MVEAKGRNGRIEIDFLRLRWYNALSYLRDVRLLVRILSRNADKLSARELVGVVWGRSTFLFLAYRKNENGMTVVGMGLIFFVLRPEGCLGEIHTVVVNPNFRGYGIGGAITEQLLKTAKRFSRHMDATIKLYLTSRSNRKAANMMYVKHGFELVAQAVGQNGTNLYKKVITPE